MGTPIIREAIDNGTSAQNIYDDYVRNDVKNFIVTREEFLIDEYAWKFTIKLSTNGLLSSVYIHISRTTSWKFSASASASAS